jgi:hypothetical protein
MAWGLSPLLKENLALRYEARVASLLALAVRAVSTAVWAAFLSAEMTVSLGASAEKTSFLPAFFSRAKKLSSILSTLTPARLTLVLVAITYFWLTLRRGTPLKA